MMSYFKLSAINKESYYELPQIVAVEDKKYSVASDFTINLGALPSDVFNKGYTIGATYTYFFKDYLGWEVINAAYSFNQVTQLNKDIQSLPNISVVNNAIGDYLEYLEYYVTSGIVYTPFYSKNLLFNESVVYGDQSLVLGAGIGNFYPSGMRLLINAGILLRFFLDNGDSIKFDFRNNVYFVSSGVINSWSIQVGYSFINHRKNKRSKPIEEKYFEQ